MFSDPAERRVPADEPARWGIRDAIVGTLLALFIPSLVGVVILVAIDRTVDDLSLVDQILLQIPLWLVLFGVCWWVTMYRGRRSLDLDFGLRMEWVDVPVGLVIGVVLQVALAVALAAVYRLVGVDADNVGESAKELTQRAVGPGGVVVALVLFAGVAPIVEELFYRGLWLGALRQHLAWWGALVVNAALFATIHFQPYDFPALFVVGLVLAGLTTRSGRLGPAIWTHVGFNATALIVLIASR